MTGNPLDSLNMKYLQSYTMGGNVPAINTFSPADMGMGLFNMPVMPQANLNTNNIFGNNNQTIPLPNSSSASAQMDWGAMFQQAMLMQNQYMENWMQSINKNFSNVTNIQNYTDLDTTGTSKTSEELKSKWEKKKPNLSDGFYNKVVNIASRIGCSPDDLMAVMNAESGISSTAVNPKGGATGLIQFMPKTAAGLGTSAASLKLMSAEEQLNYVEKYLKQAKRSAGFKENEKIDLGTLYALIFLPARAKNEVLTKVGESYYEANPPQMATKSGLAQRARQFSA